MKLTQFIFKYFGIIFLLLVLSNCSGKNELTPEEIVIQQKATNALTDILFEYELDEYASYEVEKSGYVQLRIEGLVSINTYTKAITAMREHKDIDGVNAKQGGKEICPLTIIVR